LLVNTQKIIHSEKPVCPIMYTGSYHKSSDPSNVSSNGWQAVFWRPDARYPDSKISKEVSASGQWPV
jgi:hypothetical protein